MLGQESLDVPHARRSTQTRRRRRSRRRTAAGRAHSHRRHRRPGGAGKSSSADWLAERLDAQVIRTDDRVSWENPVDWWPGLLELALAPLAAGKPARYQPTSWGGDERELLVIEPTGIVILEGVTASREAFRPYLAYSIWIETPRELRLSARPRARR
jgi:hypothetical protein